MSTPPSPPPGYAEAESQALSYPGVEIGMLAVFTGIGWALRQQHPVDTIGTAQFLAVALAIALVTELLHEGCHVLGFAIMGISSSVFWQALSVVPTERLVRRRQLMSVTLAPLFVLSSLFAVFYLFADAPGVRILAGFALAVNSTLSVLDIAVFLRQLQTPSGALYTFDTESGELAAIWVFEPLDSGPSGAVA